MVVVAQELVVALELGMDKVALEMDNQKEPRIVALVDKMAKETVMEKVKVKRQEEAKVAAVLVQGEMILQMEVEMVAEGTAEERLERIHQKVVILQKLQTEVLLQKVRMVAAHMDQLCSCELLFRFHESQSYIYIISKLK